MLSLDDIRRHLRRPDLPDDEAAAVRDTLSLLANLLIDDYLAEKYSGDNAGGPSGNRTGRGGM